MKKYLLALLLLIPLASALDCNQLFNKQWCQDIQNSKVTEAEKEYLLADVISDKKDYPDHQLVKEWNEKISTDQAPEGVTKQSQGYIKDAWVKLFAVMPSVLFNQELLIPSEGEILTGANHKVELPSGNDADDCETIRGIVDNNNKLELFFNNQLVGKGNLVNYITNSENEIKIRAEYSITVKTQIKHYQWEKKYYSKKKYKLVCEYHSTEYKTDNLVVKDFLKVKIDNPKLEAEFKIEDKYSETIKANFTFSDIVNVELTFLDAYFIQHNYVFSEVFALGNILTVKAEKKSTKEVKNLAYNGGEVVLSSLDGCMIKVDDFFQSKLIPCDYSFTSPEFTVETDKIVYADKETIKVKIAPAGDYTVQYAEEEVNSNGEMELEAKYPYNRITVMNKNRIVNQHIHLKNEKPLAMALSLGIFGMFNYALIGLVKKYWGALI